MTAAQKIRRLLYAAFLAFEVVTIVTQWDAGMRAARVAYVAMWNASPAGKYGPPPDRFLPANERGH